MLTGAHLLVPIITQPDEACRVLAWLVQVMQQRYQMLASAGVRSLDEYRQRNNQEPYIVVVIDELADLMMRRKRN